MAAARMFRGYAVGATALVLAVFGAAPAWAHVTATSDHSWRGGVAIVTFMVPNESEKASSTTRLTVDLPNVTSAHAEVMPGWSVQLDHDIPSGTFRSATWTAAPGAGIPADQFALFRIQVTLPDTDTASFPATQTYADGKVVRWDQPPLPDGSEPEHPAPHLVLTKATPGADQPAAPSAATDSPGRWLAGTALAVSAASLMLTVARRRRS